MSYGLIQHNWEGACWCFCDSANTWISLTWTQSIPRNMLALRKDHLAALRHSSPNDQVWRKALSQNDHCCLDCKETLNKKCLSIFCCTSQSKHYEKLIKIMHCHNCPTYTINNHWWHHETQVCNTDRTKLDEAEWWVSVCCVSSAPLLLSLWKDSPGTLRCGTMTSLPVFFWVYWFFKCAQGKLLYFVQEYFLSHHSWRALCISQPTDLDIITSEREITAGSNCNLLHICLFMTVCGPQSQTRL